MILISRKVDYAILALCHLGRLDDNTGASARELADAYGLSRAFVANILKTLCQHGFVESHRGVYGGYRLAQSVDAISLSSIITALDGPFQLVSCASDEESGTHGCTLAESCPISGPLQEVHDRLLATLASVTVGELLRHDLSGSKFKASASPQRGCATCNGEGADSDREAAERSEECDPNGEAADLSR